MCRGRCLETLVTFLSVAVCWSAVREAGSGSEPVAERQDSPSNESCVLLRNGNVLFGHIRRNGEEYFVIRDGAMLHLEARQVEAVCEDLVAAYWRWRRSVDPHDAVSHLKLAEWCLRQGLLERAGQELHEAARLEPSHPRVPIVARRLAVARRPARLASAAEPVEESDALPAPGVVRRAAESGGAGERFDRADHADYPDDTMEQFRRGVQPLLLNSCTTSGCHSGSGEYSFVLDRRALWRDAPRELTIANLQAVLERLDHEAPLQSRLLATAATPHARPLSRPPIPADAVAMTRLREWVLHVTGHDRPVVEAADAAQTSTDEDVNDSNEVEISDEELNALLYGDPTVRTPVRRTIQRGLARRARGPADPFDPEEFNLRFTESNRGP